MCHITLLSSRLQQAFPPEREPPVDDYDPYPDDSDDGLPDGPPNAPLPPVSHEEARPEATAPVTHDHTRYLQNMSKGAGYLPQGSPSPPPEAQPPTENYSAAAPPLPSVVRQNSRPLPSHPDISHPREAQPGYPAPPVSLPNESHPDIEHPEPDHTEKAYTPSNPERAMLPEVLPSPTAYPPLQAEPRSPQTAYPRLDTYPETPIAENVYPASANSETYPATEVNNHRMVLPDVERPGPSHPQAAGALPSYGEAHRPEQPYAGVSAYPENTHVERSYNPSPVHSDTYPPTPPTPPEGEYTQRMHPEVDVPRTAHPEASRRQSAYPEVERSTSPYSGADYSRPAHPESSYPRTMQPETPRYSQPETSRYSQPETSRYSQPTHPGADYSRAPHPEVTQQRSAPRPEVVQRPKPKEIFLYGAKDPLFEFTNFSARPIMYENKIYPTAEHLYQASKVRVPPCRSVWFLIKRWDRQFLPHKPRLAEHIRTRYNNPRDALSEAARFGAEVRRDWLLVNVSKVL